MVDLKDIIGTWSGDFWSGASEPRVHSPCNPRSCRGIEVKPVLQKTLHQCAPPDFPIFPRPYGLGTALQNLRIKPEGDCVEKGEDCFKPLFLCVCTFLAKCQSELLVKVVCIISLTLYTFLIVKH